jgi:cysteinyl-tRNA synthetase
MYICGPTVYGPPHLGHGRFALSFDILRRYLEYSGFKVIHVSNITDIDDKIIQRANQENKLTSEIASFFEAKWFEDMEKLNVLRPTFNPHATEYIDSMIDLINQLFNLDIAYAIDDGIYLEVAKVKNYGSLSNQDLESLKSGARVDVNPYKRSPMDFTLWKHSKPGEPAWSSPFGMGRPGWHTECVVMSLQLLGEGFDLHGGAQDLIFPHHENELAQAKALSKRFANHWVHCGWVTVAGEKMSKSLDNYTTLDELLSAHDARSFRLLVLQSHYRSPLEITKETLKTADVAVARLDSAFRRFKDSIDLDTLESDMGNIRQDYLKEFQTAMNNDLDTPRAMSLVFEIVTRSNALADIANDVHKMKLATDEFKAALFICKVLGLDLKDTSNDLDQNTMNLIAKRDAARISKDFKLADQIRDELSELGWVVEDTSSGTRVHK